METRGKPDGKPDLFKGQPQENRLNSIKTYRKMLKEVLINGFMSWAQPAYPQPGIVRGYRSTMGWLGLEPTRLKNMSHLA